ncbi:uncharacterized protein PV09_07472 [Verruconis gallopava]|uniref:Mannan endo-1,6-alpha-mannosidase n=1 Tax=Verruconis gallopava TaxID=253628 RepID=A0A0D1XFG5_9PEZI|nr:uncharacterized protein PV09_07472 [Verruconis gallopava]KIW00946.1 hypothetical protein PV09_07472 [Verruconis gallopava]
MKAWNRLLAGVGIARAAITLDTSSTDSIKQAASTAAWGMVKYWYTGNNTGDVPGNLPAPYYWWEAGGFFGTLIDYWYYTGDTTYNNITTQAILHQIGADSDFMPSNQTKDEGNDDQSFWAFTALAAAEYNYPAPPSGYASWLALVQAVFNEQAARWDTTTCGGGLRWQIFTFNTGYTYKNSISNGCFFNIAARLGRYTGNTTYLDWANKAWDWVSAIGLMDSSYHFFDGTEDTSNCTSLDHVQWTYNQGVFLYGAAIMWNVSATNDAANGTTTPSNTTTLWRTRVEGILNASSVFFTNNIMYEVACETNGKCDNDQKSFKTYLARWMAATTKVAPYTTDTIMNLLTTSAEACAKTCTAGADGNQCGLEWTKEANDGDLGPGQQMAAVSIFSGLLAGDVPGALTNKTGGTSVGDAAAGTTSNDSPTKFSTITTGEKAGAAILTLTVILGMFSGVWWIATDSE